ncbi:MAG: hypothetical protein WEA09_06175 [Gemmatimonadota bacterium]
MNLKNYFVVGTPILLGVDLVTGMALRVPGLEGSGLRWGYYFLLGAVAGVAVKRPSTAPFLAMGESVVNLFLVLLAILLPIWDPTPILQGGEPAILTGSQLLGSALAGAVLIHTFWQSHRQVVG